MQGITDRDVAYDMLFGSKQAALTYCHAALESATPSCVRTFTELQRRSQDFHQRVWQYLHQHQEYRVTDAHPEDVRGVRERMERLRDDHFQGQGFGGRPWESREPAPAGVGSRQGAGGYRETGWNPVGPASGAFNAGGHGAQPGTIGAPSGAYGNQSSGRWESPQRY